MSSQETPNLPPATEGNENQPVDAPTNGGGNQPVNADLEKFRISKAFWLGLGGLIAIIALSLGLAALSIWGGLSADTITAMTGFVAPFLTLIGTLVGTFFGVQVGSAGKQELAQETRDANDKFGALALAADPKVEAQFLNAYTQIRKS